MQFKMTNQGSDRKTAISSVRTVDRPSEWKKLNAGLTKTQKKLLNDLSRKIENLLAFALKIILIGWSKCLDEWAVKD